MKFLAFLFLSLVFYSANSQVASATVFSEMGEKFVLYLNSEPMNETPKSNVKMSGLTSEFYQARVDFEDASLQDCSTSNFAVQFNADVTYIVKKNKKGEYVIRFHSQTGGSSPDEAQNDGIDEGKRIADVDNQGSASPSNQQRQSAIGNSSSVTTTTTTTTSQGSAQPKGESVNVGMNINGMSMGINMNIPEDNLSGGSSNTTVTQQTTTTTHSSTSGSSSQTNNNSQVSSAGNPGSDCRYPMSSGSFNTAKESINSKSFEDSKMTVAKQVAKANCLSCNQIKEILSLFSFEESKLTFAKFAYDFCYNKAEYYTINDVFSFESSIDDLNKYIESK